MPRWVSGFRGFAGDLTLLSAMHAGYAGPTVGCGRIRTDQWSRPSDYAGASDTREPPRRGDRLTVALSRGAPGRLVIHLAYHDRLLMEHRVGGES
ncbi:hypothetical protein KCMC57_up35240 [Kitasatospora sp. CMC57]|uniref:Uncharacterized protein n=1 Tax=Kitasatospora sp. CMC57 TaxID=3231513 RepID=A0AB33JX36_9ACTN